MAKTFPIPVRLKGELRSLLAEGEKRTPHNRCQLIRLTLHRHLAEVIAEEESAAAGPGRLTVVAPWPKGALAKAYRRIGKDWDRTEAAAAKAQGKPSFKD